MIFTTESFKELLNSGLVEDELRDIADLANKALFKHGILVFGNLALGDKPFGFGSKERFWRTHYSVLMPPKRWGHQARIDLKGGDHSYYSRTPDKNLQTTTKYQRQQAQELRRVVRELERENKDLKHEKALEDIKNARKPK